jgi:hypothetical protein
LAYSIATLLNNLYGLAKSFSGSRRYTDLVKFLILLRKVVDGYTTLSEIYHYAIDESLIERDLQRGEQMFAKAAPRVRVAAHDYHLTLAVSPWPNWTSTAGEQFEHAQNDELTAFLNEGGIAYRLTASYRTQDGRTASCNWPRSSAGTTATGLASNRDSVPPSSKALVVFLSLFDDNPVVGRAFCPPKSAYTEPPKAGQKHGTPLPPLDQLLESGKVLALNFPVGLNPGLARALGAMLKLDFQTRRLVPHLPDLPDLRRTGTAVARSPLRVRRSPPPPRALRRRRTLQGALPPAP